MIDLNEVACRDAVKSFKRLLTFLDGEPTKEQLGKITATLRAANYALDLNGDDRRSPNQRRTETPRRFRRGVFV